VGLLATIGLIVIGLVAPWVLHRRDRRRHPDKDSSNRASGPVTSR